MYIENLMLEITRMCNLECEQCLRGDRRKEFMSLETIYNALKDVKEIEYLILSGGEPFLAINQMRAIAKVIKEKNIKVKKIYIETNGTILSDNVINALNELSTAAPLAIGISNDPFHYLELIRLNLLERRIDNAEALTNMFDAYEDLITSDDCIQVEDNYYIPLIEVGRLKNITSERLDEISAMLNEHYDYVLIDDRIFNFSIPKLKAKNSKVNGKVIIDVNGNITSCNRSHEEEEEDAKTYFANINKLGLLGAIINFRDYYIEYFKNLDQSVFEERKALFFERMNERVSRKK